MVMLFVISGSELISIKQTYKDVGQEGQTVVLGGKFTDRQSDHTDSQADHETDRQTDHQTDSQIDHQTDSQTDHQTDSQTDHLVLVGWFLNVLVNY